MYGWGDLTTIKKHHPEVVDFAAGGWGGYGALQVNCTYMYNFPGDCGALCLQGAHYASAETIETIKHCASLTGHSKIFATLVGKKVNLEQVLALYLAAGFKLVNEAQGNRSMGYTDYVLFYHNPDCIKKGY